MMISKLTKISSWVTYNDLELLLFNYMLLMVVIKPCETSMPKQQLGWVGCLSHGSMAVMNSLLIIYALSSRSMQEKNI
jgi:hypothetical protein